MNDLVRYFFKLGSVGFGGPAALVGYMRRDLVDDRQLIDEPTYNLSIALAQIMPVLLPLRRPWRLGTSRWRRGRDARRLAFILPSFLMVLGLSAVYVAYAECRGCSPCSTASARSSSRSSPSPPIDWREAQTRATPPVDGVCGHAACDRLDGTELATLGLVAGLLVLLVRAWPVWAAGRPAGRCGLAAVALILVLERELSTSTASGDQHVLMQILLFFTKAGSFVFGSGLAIVPFSNRAWCTTWDG
jgi:chromate transporter